MIKRRISTGAASFIKDYWIEVTTLIFALVVRLINISKSLWLDEAWALKFARGSFSEIISNSWERNPPLYYLILKIWTGIFGESELSIRFPSVIFGVGSLLIIYLLAREMFSRQVAQASLIFLALTPLLIDVSQMARTYSLLCLTSAFAFYFYYRWIREQNIKTAACLIISCSLLAYSHHFGVLNILVIVSHSFYLIIRKELRMVPTAVCFFLTALTYLPYLPFISYQSDRLGQIGFWIPPITATTFWGLFNNLTINSVQPLLGIIFALILAAGFWLSRGRTKFSELLLLWIILPLALACLYSFQVTSIFLDRYFVSLTFPITIIVSYYLLNCCKFRILKTILLSLLLCAYVYGSYQEIYNVKEDWKKITGHIESNFSKEDLIIINPLPYKYAFQYYSDLPTEDSESLKKFTGFNNYRRIWLIEPKQQQGRFSRLLSDFPASKEPVLDQALSIKLLER